MAFVPASTSRKRRLFALTPPNYKDFSGPPDGDYARYVEHLMAWAEQEQDQQRLRALGEKSRAQSLSGESWGRSNAQTVPTAATTSQPGSVDSRMERWKRKAQAQAAKAQREAAVAAAARQPGSGPSRKPGAKAGAGGKPNQLWQLVAVAIFVLTAIFATEMLPLVIMGWVGFSVFRVVRAASAAGKS